jgi:integrase
MMNGFEKIPRIPHVTPNDLRRSLGFWLRDAGVEPHLIGTVLRHADSRMAEKVYATGSKKAIAQLLAVQIAAGKAAKKKGKR